MKLAPQNNDRYLKAVCEFWREPERITEELLQDPLFFEFCSEHRMLLLLAQHPRFPKITDTNLKSVVIKLQVAQLNLLRELILIQETFAKENIPCIQLKGPVLSQLLYDKPDLRQSKDLDIWVDHRDLDRAIEVIESLAFSAKITWKTPKQKNAILKHYHSLEFVKEISGERVELHWRVPELRDLHFSEVETEEVILAGHSFRTLEKKLLYSYLCSHGAKHAYYRLLWLFDIWQMRKLYPSIKEQPGQPGWLLEILGLESTDRHKATPIEKEAFRELHEHTCLYIHKETFKDRWKKLLRYHRLNFILGGFKGLLSSLVGRNVRPENWKYFVFPDSVFFLNQLFSRFIWLIRLTLKN